MKIEILGSGGAITIPKPLCTCSVCLQARKKGLPYTRTGPSVFIHGVDILIDTPEEIKSQLNRANISNINACFYSHWHPDHTMGRRVWDMNKDWTNIPPKNKTTPIYVPENVVLDMKKFLGNWEHLTFFEKSGIISLVEVHDNETVTIGDVSIKAFKLPEGYIYGFDVRESGVKALIIMDDYFGWEPDKDTEGVDIAILPMGICEFNPLTGERRINENNPLLIREATFENTLNNIKKLNAGITVLSHIEEPDGLSYDDLIMIEKKLQSEGLNVKFAFDSLIINV